MIQNESDPSERDSKIYNTTKTPKKSFLFIIATSVVCILLIFIASKNTGGITSAQTDSLFDNSQNIKLLSASVTMLDIYAQGGPSEYFLADPEANVLIAQDGPSGTLINNYSSEFERGEISTYLIKKGDTLSEIAEKFNVSTNTIRWQNGLSHSDTIQVGQTLAILPVDGVRHVVKKGDTLGAIAKKYKGDIDDIITFNNIGDVLVIGQELIVPGGEPDQVSPPAPKKKVAKSSTTTNKTSSSYYSNPLGSNGAYTKSQGYHGRWRAIDIAVPIGAPIYASAPGRVVIASSGTWGGGYGTYIVLEHPNGSKTLYGHNSRNIARLGQYVERGEIIAYSGNTGRSTGPHLHFEIRNGIDIPCVAFGYSACY